MNTKSVTAKSAVFGLVLTSLALASSAIAAPVGELYPANVAYQTTPSQSGIKSRMQVRAEAALARAQGEVSDGEGGYATSAPTVGAATQRAAAGRTRAAVISELRREASDGTLVKTGEIDQASGQQGAGTPRRRDDVRAEAIESAGNSDDLSVVRSR